MNTDRLSVTAARLDAGANHLASAVAFARFDRFWRDLRRAIAAPIQPGRRH